MSTHQPAIPKTHWRELAVCGGRPAFDRDLHVGQPNVGNQDQLIERIRTVLDTRWFTNDGPMVQRLEKQLADYLGVRHCLTICNGTVALEIAIRALDLSGEVIVPSFTFVACAHALQWQQITPVFCDVDAATHNLAPDQVESLVNSRTTAILAVHLWGRPCDIEALSEIARHRGLKLLFDASHAFACSSRGKMIGNFGDAEVFSFHATKFFNTFEGGAIATNNDELAAKIRLMKNFGFSGYDNVIHLGTNGKMSEISAVMGLTGLESLDEFVARNRENYCAYEQELRNIRGLSLLRYNDAEKGNYQYIVVAIDEGEAGISRDRLVEILQAERVRARRYFYPGCHRMEPYRSDPSRSDTALPVTEELTNRVMVLPTGPSIGPNEIAIVCGVIRMAIENAAEIVSHFARPTPD